MIRLGSQYRKLGPFCQIFMVLTLLFSLNGCGFHLRGYAPFPTWFNGIILAESNVDLYFLREFKAALKRQHIILTEHLNIANYLLTLHEEGFKQQFLAVGAATTPRQYQLIYTVHFTLEDIKHTHHWPEQVIMVSRVVTINNDRILGSNYEEAMIKQEMLSLAVQQLIHRLQIYAH